MRKRFTMILLILAVCFNIIMPVFAEMPNDSMPTGKQSSHLYYSDEFTVENPTDASYIYMERLEFESEFGGHARLELSFETTSTMQKLGFTTLSIQHWNGNSWDDVWTVTDNYLTNTDYFPYSNYFANMLANNYYRIRVELYAKKGFLQVQKKVLISDYILCT